MEKVEQQTLDPIFVNDTTVHRECVSIIQGVHIQFIEKSAIPALIRALNEFIK